MEAFLPFLSSFVELLIQLIQQAEEYESKMRVVNCLSAIVQRAESQVRNTGTLIWQSINVF
jgi:hypothetical protein